VTQAGHSAGRRAGRPGWLVRRRRPATSRPSRLVRLTDHARSLIPIGERATAEVEAEWTAHLGKRRMDQLRDILTRLREITDPYMEP
jgi:DNA-binding MarR family transcriptional regulator